MAPKVKVEKGENGHPSTSEALLSAAKSAESISTRQEVRGGAVGGVGAKSHLKMPLNQDGSSGSYDRPTASTGWVEHGTRVESHQTASTSPRCGFGWLRDHLGRGLEEWRREENEACIDGFNDTHYRHRYKEVAKGFLPHIIGRGGRVIQKLEQFCGIFAFIEDHGHETAEVVFVGFPPAVLLGEFIVDMLISGHYSIMESLARSGF